MRPQEWRARRERLGLDREWLADHLDINVRTVARWEDGGRPVPDFAVEAMHQLETRADDEVAHHVETFTTHDVTHLLPVLAPSDDASEMPARWQRAVALRVLDEVPDLVIASAPAEHDPR